MATSLNKIETVRSLLDSYDSSPTECDGMTRICSTVLHHKNIPHQVMSGQCLYNFKLLLPIHYWIDLQEELDSWRVDYRLRMWLGNRSDVPHGIFQPQLFDSVKYNGTKIKCLPLPNDLLQILCNSFNL